MEKRKPQSRRTLENEIILAVVVLYLFIACVMIVVHFSQPEGQATETSSTSPSHSAPQKSQKTDQPPAATKSSS